MADMIFAGFGGQGVLTAGLIVAKTAMEFGDNVTWIPSYGSEMRGGTANCQVRISPNKVSSPFVQQPDILVAMNQPSVAKFMPMLRAGGVLIFNSTMVPQDFPFRDDLRLFAVPATVIAHDAGNEKGGNVVMLGALARSGVLYDPEVIKTGMVRFFEQKKRQNPKNLTVFEEGLRQCMLLN